MKNFASLGLDGWLVKQCGEMGMSKPTAIQRHCIPEILKGRDCIGCAKTGSGKTAAFALPILQKLSEDPYGVFALVLIPTRELALQISDQFKALGRSINLRQCVAIGGLDMVEQASELSKQPHVVIATPGRLAGHLNGGGADVMLRNIKFLVLDEADRLLEDTFQKDLEVIFAAISTKRQTLLFTATMSDTVTGLKANNNTFSHEVKSDSLTVSELDQRYLLIPSQVKDCYLVHLLQNFENKSIIIFTQTCRSCQVLAHTLRKIEIKCACLHSVLSQKERMSSLSRFRAGLVKILVCTDVASRGLDIPLVQLVINHNVPSHAKDYVHRVGRTARAGRGGMSLTLMTEHDVERLRAIETYINTELTEFETNEADALRLLKPLAVVKREVELRLTHNNFDFRRRHNKRKSERPNCTTVRSRKTHKIIGK